MNRIPMVAAALSLVITLSGGLFAQDSTPPAGRQTEELPERIVPPAPPPQRAEAPPNLESSEAELATQNQPGYFGRGYARPHGHYPYRGRAPRVIVRRGWEDPETILWRSQMNDFYLPHVTSSPWDPYSSTWALHGMFLARDAHTRENMRRLYNFRNMQERGQRLLTRHEQALADGVERMRRGDFVRAAIDLSLAADLNHADAACRIHLAQAWTAQRQYRRAAEALRRAFELQPKLVYIDLDLGAYLPSREMLAEHADALREHLRTASEPPDVALLLGFLRFQLGDYADAHRWFGIVRSVRPNDEIAETFQSITSASTTARAGG